MVQNLRKIKKEDRKLIEQTEPSKRKEKWKS
jgi:hypothetical protein